MKNNRELWDGSESYHLFMEHLSGRIDNIASNEIKRPLVRELRDALKFPAGNVGRYFDTRWLSSSSGFFQLIGIINRLDKQDFIMTISVGIFVLSIDLPILKMGYLLDCPLR